MLPRYVPKEQKLVVHLLYDGDVQIEYWVADDRSFEAYFPLPRERCVIEHIAQFVAEIVAEKIVLSYWKGFFRGGSRFVEPDWLEKSDHRKLS